MTADLFGAMFHLGFGYSAAERQLPFRRGEFALQSAAFLDQRDNPRGHVVGRCPERGGGFAQPVFERRQPLPRGFAGQRFDPADTACNRALADALDQCDIAKSGEIGRASGGERVWDDVETYVVDAILKKNKKYTP